MNVLKLLGANAPVAGNETLYQIIDGLGLTTNLKVCLDAGDSASYDPSVQQVSWLDTSGNGQDFFRGQSSLTPQSSDPVFNGSAGGLSSNEYWSFDGTKYFTYDTTNETWMTSLHKDNAVGSFVVMFYNVGSGGSYNHFGTHDVSPGTGVTFSKNSANQLRWFVRNGSSTVFSFTTTETRTTAGWCFAGMSVNEASNSLLIKYDTNDISTTCTYSSPSTGSAAITARIASGNGDIDYPNNSRMACFAAWDTNLTAQNLTDIYDAIKGRFGL